MGALITYIIISVFTPGPNNIFASVSTSRTGFKNTLRFMFGVFFGTLIIFVLTGMLNLFFYNNINIINKIIGIVGGTFIVYLGIKMFFNRKTEKLLISNNKLFTMGIFLNFINAKTIIFGLTVTTLYLNLELNQNYLIYFDMILAILCFVAVVVWGLFGKVFKDFLTKYKTIYNIVMAILLAYSGVIVIVESF